jgi:hypothetical protein
VARFDVRRLAAADMYGTVGSPVRRRVIVVEFITGLVGCLALGIVALLAGGPVQWAIGAWLCGVALNYVPLAAHAISLTRPGALAAELSGVDVRAELMHYALRQLWIVVPLFVVIAALRPRPAR